MVPPMSSAPPIFAFAEFQLNVGEQQLLRNGRPLALPPKAFDVLVALVESGGHLVARETLLKWVWPDTFRGMREPVLQHLGDPEGAGRPRAASACSSRQCRSEATVLSHAASLFLQSR